MRENWFREARLRTDWLQLHLVDGTLLEVGCGTGEFLKVSQDQGFDVYGVEPSRWAADEARQLGVEVEAGFVSDWVARYPGLRPHAVALWHVLEHVPTPEEFLRELAAIIRPSGLLVLEVPNFGSSKARRLGLDWSSAQVNDHYFHFTPDGLSQLLVRAGFEMVQLLPIADRIYGSAESWRRDRNGALLDGHEWPPLELLRAVAHTPATSSSSSTSPQSPGSAA